MLDWTSADEDTTIGAGVEDGSGVLDWTSADDDTTIGAGVEEGSGVLDWASTDELGLALGLLERTSGTTEELERISLDELTEVDVGTTSEGAGVELLDWPSGEADGEAESEDDTASADGVEVDNDSTSAIVELERTSSDEALDEMRASELLDGEGSACG